MLSNTPLIQHFLVHQELLVPAGYSIKLTDRLAIPGVFMTRRIMK